MPTLRALTVLALLLSPVVVLDAVAGPKAAEQAQTGLVFALRTGPEDVTALESAFRHARAVKESGVLSDVTVIVYGRAIVVFDPNVTLPGEIRTNLEGARSAGVHILACDTALRKYGISPEDAARSADVVPQGIVEIARLVAAGHEVLSY